MTDSLIVRSRCLMWLAALCPLLARDLPALQWQVPSCEQYEAAVRANPANLDAASRLGRCAFRDYEMVAPDGDSTRLRFRSSWSTALRATRHAVDLDPSYAPAYRPLFAILFAETRDGCSAITGDCAHVAAVVRNGDTVITVPRLALLNSAERDTYAEVIRESRAAQSASLIEARDLARRWAGVAPNERQPHEYLGRALLRLGDPEAASVDLERAATLGTPESRRRLFWERVEALVRSDRGEDVRRLVDEASSDPGRDTTRLNAYKIASLNALVGRYRPPPNSPVDSARARMARERLDSMIRQYRSSPPPKGVTDLLAVGDSAGARRRLAEMDSTMASRLAPPRFARVWPDHLESARYHLALGDTAGAEARLKEIEQPFQEHPFEFSVTRLGGYSGPWLGPVWLLSADVSAARHRPEDAARMYRRVIGLWGGGDPNLLPVVDQARAKLRAMSAR